MPVPLPTDDVVDLNPPTAEESVANAAGVLSATRTADGNTEFQRLLIEATFEAMTGHRVDTADLPVVTAEEAAETLRLRAEPYSVQSLNHSSVMRPGTASWSPASMAASMASISSR